MYINCKEYNDSACAQSFCDLIIDEIIFYLCTFLKCVTDLLTMVYIPPGLAEDSSLALLSTMARTVSLPVIKDSVQMTEEWCNSHQASAFHPFSDTDITPIMRYLTLPIFEHTCASAWWALMHRFLSFNFFFIFIVHFCLLFHQIDI